MSVKTLLQGKNWSHGDAQSQKRITRVEPLEGTQKPEKQIICTQSNQSRNFTFCSREHTILVGRTRVKTRMKIIICNLQEGLGTSLPLKYFARNGRQSFSLQARVRVDNERQLKAKYPFLFILLFRLLSYSIRLCAPCGFEIFFHNFSPVRRQHHNFRVFPVDFIKIV